jgi:hypothetical protein
MELWIRTQDRTTLIRSYEIYIAEHSDSYVIRAKRTSHILGAYKTIERALEVLDEIMELLKDEEILHIRKSSLNTLDEMAEPKYILKPVGQPRVYEMPLE